MPRNDFQITDSKYCSINLTNHEKKFYIIQFEKKKCSFLTKLSSVYDWLDLQVFIFTEIQSMECKHSGQN